MVGLESRSILRDEVFSTLLVVLVEIFLCNAAEFIQWFLRKIPQAPELLHLYWGAVIQFDPAFLSSEIVYP